MNTDATSRVPPGFRFHPTDEELVDYYLRKKVARGMIDLDVIKDVDLYKIEPWDLQEICRIGAEGQNEWYFFSHKDKKYPTGTRTNRATTAGFWKATGRDKPIYAMLRLIGMRKTLVYYKGRAPNGQKSDWIMHEYRLETNENGPPQEEGWVVCRVFKKRVPTARKSSDELAWYDDQASSFLQELEDSPPSSANVDSRHHSHHFYPYRISDSNHNHQQYQFLMATEQNPNKLLSYDIHDHGRSPGNTVRFILADSSNNNSNNSEAKMLQPRLHRVDVISIDNNSSNSDNNNHNDNASQASEQVTDWRVLDKFVASQLSYDGSKEPINYSGDRVVHRSPLRANDQELQDAGTSDHPFPSTSTSSCQIYPWK